MKRLLSIITIFLVICIGISGDDRDKYLELLNTQSYSELEKHLFEWQNKENQNPEVYIAFFNYYLQRNMHSGFEIAKNIDQSQQHMTLTDPDTGEVVGYMGSKNYYNIDDVDKALEYLDIGLNYGLDRLDMYFGKAHILQEIGKYREQSEVVIQTLYRSIDNNNNWKWTLNEIIPDAQMFLLNNLQDYYQFWLQIGTEDCLSAVLNTATVQIELYPENIYAYNNLSVYYIEQKDFERALQVLLVAHEFNKNDSIIIGNIGLLYYELGKKDEAIKYLTILVNSYDVQISNWAKNIIASIMK